MILRDPTKRDVAAELTTAHPSSSYGRAVVLVDGEGCGPCDLPGWTIVAASAEELEGLRAAGFELASGTPS